MGSSLLGPDALRLFLQALVLLTLDSESWVPFPFNKLPECSHAQISNIVKFKEEEKKRKKGAQGCPVLHTYIEHELRFLPVLPISC